MTLTFLTVAAVDALTSIRPGGGGSFSGGSHGGGGGGFGGGGGGGGGGGFILWALFNLLPWPLQLLVIIGVVAFFFMQKRPSRQMQDWSTNQGGGNDAFQYGGGPAQYPTARAESPRATLSRLRQIDPTFSLVLFEDFLYSLYDEAHQRRARGELDMLSAYLSPDVIARMNTAAREPIQGVVIGALKYVSARISGDGPAAMASVTVEFDVNLTVQGTHGPTSAYLLEAWTLVRRAGAKTRPVDKSRIFACPNCGAPQSAVMAGRCSHCNQAVSTGEFGWVVQRAEVLRFEPKPPLLTTEVEEEGTNFPTIVDPNARQGLDALWQRDQAFQWPEFEKRIGLIFSEFQVAWSNRDLAKMRPFLSDNLFQMQGYWVEAYKTQHLRNVTENARIASIELARIDSDASFDAITVRLFASSLDYTVTDEGKLVCGSKSRERRYTEYWTLIRGAGRKGPTRTEPVCPNCGAPLAINMVGTCTYCQAKVTTGEFDWVLSRIEQDEVYVG